MMSNSLNLGRKLNGKPKSATPKPKPVAKKKGGKVKK